MMQQKSAAIADDLQLISIPVFARQAGGVNYFTVAKWIARGRLKSVKVGGRRLIPISELQRICKEGLAA